VPIWQDEAGCAYIVETALLLSQSKVQGAAKPACVLFRKAKNRTLECAGICLASSLHSSCNLKVVSCISDTTMYASENGIYAQNTSIYACVLTGKVYNIPVSA
jgi:hypothetical protein